MHSVLESDVEEAIASYVELARERGMPVVSSDGGVLDGASKLGVEAFDLDSFARMP